MTTTRQVVRQVVATAAPHELPLLDSLEMLDDTELTEVFTGRERRTDPVGFGVTEVSVLVAPVVWIVVSEVVKRGTGVMTDSLFAKLRSWWRRLRRRQPHRSPTVPALTAAQLEGVHARTIEQAAAAGIDGDAGRQLADAVVSALARGAGAAGTEPEVEPGVAG